MASLRKTLRQLAGQDHLLQLKQVTLVVHLTTTAMTDIKHICARLIELWDADCDINVEINELRAALAEPEPEGPTDKELMALVVQVFDDSFATYKDYARAVLARWGK